MKMTEHKGLPVLSFATQTLWGNWLAEHGAASSGIWLKLARKTSDVASVSKPEAIEAALAFGWIDGQLDRCDEGFWLVRFTPRARHSKWSQVNRDTVARLLAERKMAPAGVAEIEQAKADGRWDAAYPPQSKAGIPDDLQARLDAYPAAKAFFATLKGANRYAILYRIHDAKTEKTRAARIEKFVDMLGQGRTIYPDKG
jgi:uncharacterized protein YdeI (YjbR/CyaY-like superfamily)